MGYQIFLFWDEGFPYRRQRDRRRPNLSGLLRLGVTPGNLELWIRGVVSTPGDVFLKATEIVGQHDLQQMRNRRPLGEGDPA
jgi:hypothetical protein